jgi:DNA polymerase-1
MSSVPLLLVDGHNLLFRACFGTPAQIYSRDPARRDITTQFMFFALLRKAITDELGSWPEVLVVFDGEYGSAGRQLADPGYKANRPDDAEARRPLAGLADIKTGLDLFAVTWIELDDTEADDVIATLTHTDRLTRDVLILSTDRDYYQLLADPDKDGRSVRILNTARRPGTRLLGPAHVRDRYGVAPSRFPDLRALAGDPADNIPGVRGIGPKSAAALLADGLALDDLPTSGRLTGTRGAAALAAWPQLLIWRDMIRLRLDVPLPASPSGDRTPPLPISGEIITKLGLWWAPDHHHHGPAPRTSLR